MISLIYTSLIIMIDNEENTDNENDNKYRYASIY